MGLSDYWNHTLENEQDSVLVGRIAAMLPSQRAEFDRILKELLPEISSWKVELSRGQSFIQYITKAGAQHSADLFGDGMASLFRVSLAIVDSGAGQILVIDEPELSLHPQAQKSLAAMLSRCASDRQILITTHSPYFVSWADLANGAKVYRLAQGEDGVSVEVLDPYTIENLKGLTDDWQKPNLLDAVSREIFFADEVLFLEGQDDMGLLRKFCDDRSLPQMATFGYGAGGFGNIEHFLDMAEDLNIRAAAVYDGDHADAKARAERNFPDALIKILPTPDIRDKLVRDSNNKETDQIQKLGIFDSAGVLKTEYESYLVGLIDEIRGFLKVN
jgi:predicted ATP-dependent endonuclease of OLD family